MVQQCFGLQDGLQTLIFCWKAMSDANKICRHLLRCLLILLLLFSCSVVSGSVVHGLQHARLPSLSLTISQSLLKLMSIDSVMPSNHLILCLPLLLLLSIFPDVILYMMLTFIDQNFTNIFFILGIMVYRDGGQIMSG